MERQRLDPDQDGRPPDGVSQKGYRSATGQVGIGSIVLALGLYRR
jgi:hypothetical protein